jgi:hypothetical protein
VIYDKAFDAGITSDGRRTRNGTLMVRGRAAGRVRVYTPRGREVGTKRLGVSNEWVTLDIGRGVSIVRFVDDVSGECRTLLVGR